MIKQKSFKDFKQLQEHIKSGEPTLYCNSKTSTVIPYERLENLVKEECCLGDLSSIPGDIKLLENGDLVVSGGVTWKDAREFCRKAGRDIKTYPTEELAGVCAGVASSATGERSFGFGPLRDHVKNIVYYNHLGEEVELKVEKNLSESAELLEYQKSYEAYKQLKNAPFPRLDKETDLLIGTEGQLGVIKQVTIETTESVESSFIFITLPRWEDDYKPHLEVFEKIQKCRDKVCAVELLDSNALAYLSEAERPVSDKDLIFLELSLESFDEVYEEFLAQLELVDEEGIFEMPSAKCRELRMSIPRAIYEKNEELGVNKKGTDVQVSFEKFENLLAHYREWSKGDVKYTLFGHFGDAHLHFNFMPLPDQEKACMEKLEGLYAKVLEWQGSPFAEHGIGILKQPFIMPFLKPAQLNMFKVLKEKMDPERKFFPGGFMELYR